MSWSPPRPERVQEIFRSISPNYDLANRVLSLGLDQYWRRQLVTLACKTVDPLRSVLDVATGTGDLALAFRRRLGTEAKIIGVDFCPAMLEVAAKKEGAIDWREADAVSLPFEGSRFDVVAISFGLRNVSDTDRALLELHRVLRPGGALIILEFGHPGRSLLGRIIGWINRFWLKAVGGAITGSGWAYQYLSQTSEAFPGAADFAARARRLFPEVKVETRKLFPEICYLCVIEKS